MPRQGQSVETCRLIEWKKKEGEAVRSGEVLCEVETDKAVFEVEAPAAGCLLKTFYPQGADVPVLARIALIGEQGEDISPFLAVEEAAGAREAGQAQPAAVETPGLRISPRARRLAEARGLSLSDLAGTGPGGRILARDVEKTLALQAAPTQQSEPTPQAAPTQQAAPTPQAALTQQAAPTPQAAIPAAGTEIPLQGVRKLIAGRLLSSLRDTAQYTLSRGAGAEALLRYREVLKRSPVPYGLRAVTLNDLILFALSRVLPDYPQLNAHFLGDKLVQFRQVNLGFAVDTPRGLMVPVLHRAEGLSLKRISTEARRLAARCLEGKVGPKELEGGTFTVTNLGSLGIETFTPILNPPQVAILGVGAVQLRPLEREGAVVHAPFLTLSLTANHQVVDGAPAARFLRRLAEALEGFELLLAGG